MKVFLLKHGPEGCDYTIGCGMSITQFDVEAETLEEAVQEFRPANLDDDDEEDDESLLDDGCVTDAWIVRAADCVKLPLAVWRKELEDRYARKAAESDEAKERAELERLKKKYEEA